LWTKRRSWRSKGIAEAATAAAERSVPTEGTVTRVEVQARPGAERVNIHLDGAYAFSLAAEIGLALREGDQLDASAVRELQARDEVERAYQRALGFLTHRPRSLAEVRERLARHGHGPEVADAVLERLAGHHLVDDREFGTFWVTQRQTFHPCGPRALRWELRRKGLDAELADQAISAVASQQDDAAYRAASKKARSLAARDEPAFVRALSDHLVRRGFDFETVRTAVRRLQSECYAPSEGPARDGEG
jgi:regulatory protein